MFSLSFDSVSSSPGVSTINTGLYSSYFPNNEPNLCSQAFVTDSISLATLKNSLTFELDESVSMYS